MSDYWKMTEITRAEPLDSFRIYPRLQSSFYQRLLKKYPAVFEKQKWTGGSGKGEHECRAGYYGCTDDNVPLANSHLSSYTMDRNNQIYVEISERKAKEYMENGRVDLALQRCQEKTSNNRIHAPCYHGNQAKLHLNAECMHSLLHDKLPFTPGRLLPKHREKRYFTQDSTDIKTSMEHVSSLSYSDKSSSAMDLRERIAENNNNLRLYRNKLEKSLSSISRSSKLSRCTEDVPSSNDPNGPVPNCSKLSDQTIKSYHSRTILESPPDSAIDMDCSSLHSIMSCSGEMCNFHAETNLPVGSDLSKTNVSVRGCHEPNLECHEPILELVKRCHEPNLESVRGRHEPNLESVRGHHEPNLEPVRGRHEPNLESVRGHHEPNLESVRGHHEPNLEPVRGRHEPNLESVRGHHEPNLEPVRGRHEPNLEPVRGHDEASPLVTMFASGTHGPVSVDPVNSPPAEGLCLTDLRENPTKREKLRGHRSCSVIQDEIYMADGHMLHNLHVQDDKSVGGHAVLSRLSRGPAGRLSGHVPNQGEPLSLHQLHYSSGERSSEVVVMTSGIPSPQYSRGESHVHFEDDIDDTDPSLGVQSGTRDEVLERWIAQRYKHRKVVSKGHKFRARSMSDPLLCQGHFNMAAAGMSTPQGELSVVPEALSQRLGVNSLNIEAHIFSMNSSKPARHDRAIHQVDDKQANNGLKMKPKLFKVKKENYYVDENSPMYSLHGQGEDYTMPCLRQMSSKPSSSVSTFSNAAGLTVKLVHTERQTAYEASRGLDDTGSPLTPDPPPVLPIVTARKVQIHNSHLECCADEISSKEQLKTKLMENILSKMDNKTMNKGRQTSTQQIRSAQLGDHPNNCTESQVEEDHRSLPNVKQKGEENVVGHSPYTLLQNSSESPTDDLRLPNKINMQSSKDLRASKQSVIQSAKAKIQGLRKARSLDDLDQSDPSLTNVITAAARFHMGGSMVNVPPPPAPPTHVRKSTSLRSIFSFTRKKSQANRELSKKKRDRSNSALVSRPKRNKKTISIDCVDVPTHPRAIGRLLELRADGTQTVELVRPPHGPFGIYIGRATPQYNYSVFVSRFSDGHPEKLFTGLLSVGDEILEINNEPVNALSLDEIYDLMASSSHMVLRTLPTLSHTTDQ